MSMRIDAMLDVELHYEDGQTSNARFALPLDIGRSAQCGLRIAAWRVARLHARISHRTDGIFVDDFGSLGGTLVNGTRITHYGPLQAGDELVIGPCLMRIRSAGRASSAPGPMTAPPAYPQHTEQRLPVASVAQAQADGSVQADETAGAVEQARSADLSEWACIDAASMLQHRQRLHRALLEALDLRRRDVAALSDTALRQEAELILRTLLRDDTSLPAQIDRERLAREVVDEAVGLGPLEPLLADPAISEIMVNRHDEIFIESQGRLRRHEGGFSSEQAVLGVLQRIVSPLGRRIDESSPMVDARLRDGSRVNAVIPPIALRGASITVRKFPQRRLHMQDLLAAEALDEPMCEFLRACVKLRKNIVVAGGTGSGKTTLLNILSNFIPESERIITIEDAAELQLHHTHQVRLEARPANLEGRGKVDIRDLVRNALRMRPDRIVVGECRGPEAFDMLSAMNTGHEGSLTTLHANNPRDALARLETMILMAGMDLPLAAVREHIAASVDVLVQQVRAADGHRHISAIVEVTGMESGRIQTQPLFLYRPGPPPAFCGCDNLPDFLHDEDGMAREMLPAALFGHRTEVCLPGGRRHPGMQAPHMGAQS